jgi:hypothetical protein
MVCPLLDAVCAEGATSTTIEVKDGPWNGCVGVLL